MKAVMGTTCRRATTVALALCLIACSKAGSAKGNGNDSTPSSAGGDNGDPGVSVPVPMGLLSGDNLASVDAAALGTSSGGSLPSSGAAQSVDDAVTTLDSIVSAGTAWGSMFGGALTPLIGLMNDLFSTSGYFQGATIYVTPGQPKLFAVKGPAAQDPLQPLGVRVSVVSNPDYPFLVEVFCASGQDAGALVGCLRVEFKTFATGDSQAHVHLSFFDPQLVAQGFDGLDMTYDTSQASQQGIFAMTGDSTHPDSLVRFTLSGDAANDRALLTLAQDNNTTSPSPSDDGYFVYRACMSPSTGQIATFRTDLKVPEPSLLTGPAPAALAAANVAVIFQYFLITDGKRIAQFAVGGRAPNQLDQQLASEVQSDPSPLVPAALLSATMPAMSTVAAPVFQGAAESP